MINEKSYDEVIDARERLMKTAVNDTRKWCVGPRVLVGRWYSDQYWMNQFSPSNVLRFDSAAAHSFLVSFQLTNRVRWDKQQVAAEVAKAVSTETSDVVTAVEALAAALRKSNERRTRQTSAASKIMMFAKPGMPFFIWDRLTACSAHARDWHRDGRRRASYSKGVFLDAVGQHDYGAHHRSCGCALADEQTRNDFQSAVEHIDVFLRNTDGPMGDRRLVTLDFVRRRLLDKLMFWEGWLMTKGSLPA